jgi:hypothetical protein
MIVDVALDLLKHHEDREGVPHDHAA